MISISDLIYEKRKAAGLTQEKLAEISNVNRITIRRYENGDFKNLDFKQLFDISKSLNFNLINYLSVYFEGLSMEEYLKLVSLFKMIINLQKDKVEAFIICYKNDNCFKIKIGHELFCYASALVLDEKKEYQIALHKCYEGLDIDILTNDISNLSSKSVIFLRLMILSATLLIKLGNYRRSEQIYLQVYEYISNLDSKDNLLKNQLFYSDFNEFRVVILCNLTHLYNNSNKYKKSIELCEEAVQLMFESKTFKFFYPIVVNKALALYLLNDLLQAKSTLFQVYHYLMSVNQIQQLESFKKLIFENFPKIGYVTTYMTEPDLNE